MDNVLIDDRRIHVRFSQSMHGLWRNYKRFGKKGGTAEDGNEAGERGARREGRVNREFVAGDGRRTYESRVRRWATSAAGPPPIAAKDGGENRARRRVTIGEKTTEDGTRGYAANEVEAGTAIDAEMRTAIGAGEGTGAGTGAETETGTQTGTGTGIERRTANASVVAVGIETGRRIAGAIGVGAEAATLLGGTAETNVGERMRRDEWGLDAPRKPRRDWRFANRRETRRGRTSTTIRAGVVIDRGGRRRSRRRVFARKSGVSPRDD